MGGEDKSSGTLGAEKSDAVQWLGSPPVADVQLLLCVLALISFSAHFICITLAFFFHHLSVPTPNSFFRGLPQGPFKGMWSTDDEKLFPIPSNNPLFP
jgi:hypothetical protein